MDISYLNVAGTFYFLISLLDGDSRYIVHWEIREKMEESDVDGTSTAVARSDSRLSAYCVLTQKQVRHPSFPDSFDLARAADALERLPEDLRASDVPRVALLVNTGCMVYRLAQWRLGIKFEQLDDIVEIDGRYSERSLSEDWSFSRYVAEHGGKVMATRLIKVTHWGKVDWRSDEVWGDPRWL